MADYTWSSARRVPRGITRGRRERDRWAEHARFMRRLAAEPFVILAGPIGKGDGENALLVVDADSQAAIRARLAEDPRPEDLPATESIRPWSVWVRSPAPAQDRANQP